MRRVALLLVLVAACRSAPVADTSLTGAATPRASLDRFLAAARAQDLQALGADFGDAQGALRDHSDRATTERRLLIMLQRLRHDKAVVSAPSRGEGGTQVFSVNMTQGSITADAKFAVVKGPAGRWFVQQFDIVTLQNKGFCSKTGG
jgi:hypothetical protein